MRISIADDFSDTPIGRYPSDSPNCGANFRDNLLIPALKNSPEVEVEIDRVEGYGSSFLEEAFGGLVRLGFTESDLKKKLRVVYKKASFKTYELVIWSYIKEAQELSDNGADEEGA